MTDSELLSPAAAAAFLGVSIKTLNMWRTTKRITLPYVKVGSLVRYTRADLEAFVSARKVG